MIRRILLAFAGVVLLAVAGALSAAAAWAWTTFDADGVLRFDTGRITPSQQALAVVVDVERFGAEVPFIGDLGTERLTVLPAEHGAPGDLLFLGAGETAGVDEYLFGAPYDVAVRDGDTWTTRTVPGGRVPPPPADAAAWLAADTGPSPSVVVPSERPLTIAIMHPGGVPSGPVDVAIDFVVPQARAWTAWLAAGAILTGVLGVSALVAAVRLRSRRGRHEPTSASAVPGASETGARHTSGRRAHARD